MTITIPWDEWQAIHPEIERVAEQFVFANCYDPKFASIVLQKNRPWGEEVQCQVSETHNPLGFVENDSIINLNKNL